MNRKDILEETIKTVCNDRQSVYGDPENSFPIIAAFWETYLTQVNGKEVKITARQAAEMLALFKLARISTGKFKKDNYVDLCGYAAIAGSLENEQKSIDEKVKYTGIEIINESDNSEMKCPEDRLNTEEGKEELRKYIDYTYDNSKSLKPKDFVYLYRTELGKLPYAVINVLDYDSSFDFNLYKIKTIRNAIKQGDSNFQYLDVYEFLIDRLDRSTTTYDKNVLKEAKKLQHTFQYVSGYGEKRLKDFAQSLEAFIIGAEKIDECSKELYRIVYNLADAIVAERTLSNKENIKEIFSEDLIDRYTSFLKKCENVNK